MDYRQMPIDQLDSNIPKGRGMIKWAPFATMPEQFERVDAMIEAQSKISRPELSDDRLAEMDHTMKKAIHEKRNVRIEYYYDGLRFHVDLQLLRVDRWSLMLIGQRLAPEDEMVFISFIDILDITMLDH
ncbi:YolD-like family protein [Salinicoccus siamensis]|uniref:YolD-like family protein n=1 Tax=Salinicoccus siamensis TaxID=381830 RepID=A0ABV5Z4B7_9STAP